MEYKAVRYPAQLFETKVLSVRLPEDNPARLGYERLLGSLDSAAGRLLADEGLAQRGRVLTRRAEVLEKAVALEAKPAERREAADAELRPDNKRSSWARSSCGSSTSARPLG